MSRIAQEVDRGSTRTAIQYSLPVSRVDLDFSTSTSRNVADDHLALSPASWRLVGALLLCTTRPRFLRSARRFCEPGLGGAALSKRLVAAMLLCGADGLAVCQRRRRSLVRPGQTTESVRKWEWVRSAKAGSVPLVPR